MEDTIKTVIFLSTLISNLAYADVYVEGYTTDDGTMVSPHYRSDPDNRVDNNYSYQGDINPYTGNVGTKNTDSYHSMFSGSGGNNTSNGTLNPPPTPLGGYPDKLGGGS